MKIIVAGNPKKSHKISQNISYTFQNPKISIKTWKRINMKIPKSPPKSFTPQILSGLTLKSTHKIWLLALLILKFFVFFFLLWMSTTFKKTKNSTPFYISTSKVWYLTERIWLWFLQKTFYLKITILKKGVPSKLSFLSFIHM